MRISEAVLSDLESFFEYIGAQLLENADDNSPLFQPISKENCVVSEQFKDKFQMVLRQALVNMAGESSG